MKKDNGYLSDRLEIEQLERVAKLERQIQILIIVNRLLWLFYFWT